MKLISLISIMLLLTFLFQLVISCPDNCLYCQINSTCITCLTNYSLTNQGNCILPTIQNCRVYQNSQICAVCQPTFKVQNKQCVKDFSGCLIRDEKGICKKCFMGTSLDINGNCLGVINCIFPTKRCNSCQKGYILQNNICKYNKSDCLNILNNGLCGNCANGYILNGFQCVNKASNAISPNSNFIQFCSLYSQNQGSCLQCKQGYSLFQNICQVKGYINNQTIISANQKLRQNNIQTFIFTSTEFFNYQKSTYSLSPNNNDVLDAPVQQINQLVFSGLGNEQHCLIKQSNSNACQSCIDGYYLSNGSCIKKTPICLQVNLTNFRCLKCNQKFALINGDCVDLNCNISSYSVCKICNNGYLLSSQGICQDVNCNQIINGTCKKCNLNYHLSSTNQCASDIPNCAKYNSENSVCIQCLSGYNLSSSGKCDSADPKCLTFSEANCIQCKPHFSLINGICFDLNCKQLLSPIRCSVCNDNYSLNSQGYCFDPNCVKLVNGSCIQCSNNYKLLNGLCVINNNICTSYSNNGSCLNCTSSYALVNGNCVDLHCKDQQYTNGYYVCLVCKPGFNISTSGVCYDQNCYRSINGSCSRCADNYVVNPNGLCQLINVGCLTFDYINFRCIKCLSNYTINSLGQCTNTNNIIPSQLDNTSTLTLNNITKDPNCLQRNNITNACTNCNNRYYIINGECVVVPTECQNYNMQTGKCITCINGFALYQQGVQVTCIQRPNVTDPNCLATDLNSFCIRCKSGFYILNGVCYLADTMCKTFNLTGGQCLTCYDGYVLQQSKCIALTKQANCKTFDYQNVCIQCFDRYYLNKGACLAVNSLCLTYQPINGGCLSCISGYALANLNCISVTKFSQNCQNLDNSGLCLTCISGYYLNNNYTCSPVSSLCVTYNVTNGNCLTCMNGYLLNFNNTCIVSTDSNCLQINQNNTCTKCANNYYLSNGRCLANNPLCANYSSVTGLCIKCISLYYLSSNSSCLAQVPKNSKDPNCLLANLNNYCLQCPSGYYISQGNCHQSNQLCKTYDLYSGYCTSCYDGYQLIANNCTSINQVVNQDPNCLLFSGSLCIQCNNRFYLNSSGSKLICSSVNSLCDNYEMLTGNCLSCISGFQLNGTSCISSSNNSYIENSTINCTLYDSIKKTCVLCYTGFYYNQGLNSCQINNALCKTTNLTSGQCIDCFDEYQLVGGNCKNSTTTINNIGSNIYCTKFNGTACIQCMNRYYVKNQTCFSIDPNCLAYNSTNGNCLACYSGYVVNQLGGCILPSSSSSTISDPFCTNVVNGKCVNCLNGYYVDNLTGLCTIMSILCINYDMLSGVCTKCASGNILQDGVCFTPALGVDPNCALYTGVYCSGCNNGYKLVSFVCQKSS